MVVVVVVVVVVVGWCHNESGCNNVGAELWGRGAADVLSDVLSMHDESTSCTYPPPTFNTTRKTPRAKPQKCYLMQQSGPFRSVGPPFLPFDIEELFFGPPITVSRLSG